MADGIPDEDVDVVLELLVDRYRAWFAFLLGARRATVPPPPRRLRLITSRDAGRAAAIARVLPGVPATVLPLEHADLLRAEPLDRTIRDLLDHADADDALGQVRDGIR